jgi:hypothetical protein
MSFMRDYDATSTEASTHEHVSAEERQAPPPELEFPVDDDLKWSALPPPIAAAITTTTTTAIANTTITTTTIAATTTTTTAAPPSLPPSLPSSLNENG